MSTETQDNIGKIIPAWAEDGIALRNRFGIGTNRPPVAPSLPIVSSRIVRYEATRRYSPPKLAGNILNPATCEDCSAPVALDAFVESLDGNRQICAHCAEEEIRAEEKHAWSNIDTTTRLLATAAILSDDDPAICAARAGGILGRPDEDGSRYEKINTIRDLFSFCESESDDDPYRGGIK